MDDLNAIQTALQSGDKRLARQLLRPLLDTAPTADLWYLASTACESTEQEIGCLRRALKLDPQHPAARPRYKELRSTLTVDELPPLEALVDALPPLELLTVAPPSILPKIDAFAIKRQQQRQRDRRWTYLGCIGSLLLSLSSSYFVLTVMGSPIAAQVRQILGGDSPQHSAVGTPVFGIPIVPTAPSLFDDSQEPPVDGETSPNNPANAASGAPPNAASSSSSDSQQFVVQPDKSVHLESGSPVSDVLDPGYAHEYIFEAQQGEEVAIAIQFFSPNAKRVASNVAILDPDGHNAGLACQAETIFTDGSGVAFICQIRQTGAWKLQVFGQADVAAGAYIVTFESM